MKFFLSQTFLKPAKAVYLWLIALCIGAIFCAGAFSASVIFNAESFGVNLGNDAMARQWVLCFYLGFYYLSFYFS